MAENGKRKRNQTPESRFYDTLKGQMVRVTLSRNGEMADVTLLWVDRYSVGIRFELGREVLLNKRAIETIELLQPQGKRQNGERDNRGDSV